MYTHVHVETYPSVFMTGIVSMPSLMNVPTATRKPVACCCHDSLSDLFSFSSYSSSSSCCQQVFLWHSCGHWFDAQLWSCYTPCLADSLLLSTAVLFTPPRALEERRRLMSEMILTSLLTLLAHWVTTEWVQTIKYMRPVYTIVITDGSCSDGVVEHDCPPSSDGSLSTTQYTGPVTYLWVCWLVCLHPATSISECVHFPDFSIWF